MMGVANKTKTKIIKDWTLFTTGGKVLVNFGVFKSPLIIIFFLTDSLDSLNIYFTTPACARGGSVSRLKNEIPVGFKVVVCLVVLYTTCSF